MIFMLLIVLSIVGMALFAFIALIGQLKQCKSDDEHAGWCCLNEEKDRDGTP